VSSPRAEPATIVIAPLADHIEHLSLLADWNFGFWGRVTGRSREGYVARLSGYLQRDRLPIALIALADGIPAGTACVNFDDMSARPDLAPWLANLYVESAFRGRGIGSALVRAAEDAARRAGHGRLYLYTPDQERLYAGLGWQVTARCPQDGESVVVMLKEL